MNIFVRNISFNTTDNDLRGTFEAFGEVSSARVIMDRETQRSRGFGFVEMATPEEAGKAVETLNEKQFQGRALTIKEALPREPRSGSEFRKGGRN